LKSRNIAVLESTLKRVSNPNHADYGKWLSLAQINELTQPLPEDRLRLTSWLARHNVRGSITGDSIICTATVRDATTMFNAVFYSYHRSAREVLIRVRGTYSVPDEVADLIVFVTGMFNFPLPRPPKITTIPSPSQDNENGKVVPEVIRDLYQIPATFVTNDNSSICLAEFQNSNSFSADDLATFEPQTLTPNVVVAKDHIIGPNDPLPPAAESTLDVQYGTGMALNATIWYWTSTGWMYDFATQFLQTQQVPFIVSMSWGWPETKQCQVGTCNGLSDEQYVQECEQAFLKITLRGVTLLAASGDQGAPGDGNPDCLDEVAPLSSIYPGDSAYFLSVGATMLDEPSVLATSFQSPICQTYSCATSTTELVCTYPDALITSGGGFADYITRPTWQSSVVDTYLKSGVALPPAKYYNSTNRAWPDVAALGHNYLIYISSRWEIVDGTSCSTPVWGGLISLWNDARLNQGKPTLGFVNPAVYDAYSKNAKAYNDITTGNNTCTESCCSDYGYQATTGWDAVTGLGTPNFPALNTYFQSLP